MGITLMHEHMVLAYPGWDLDPFCEQLEPGQLANIWPARWVRSSNTG